MAAVAGRKKEGPWTKVARQKLPDERGFVQQLNGEYRYFNSEGKPRAAKQNEPGWEAPDMKFRRLVVKRMNVALLKIGLVGNLATRSIYTYTDEQVVKVVQSLENAVDAVKQRFTGQKTADNEWRL